MRIVVYGAGAIGGVVGGRLFSAGHQVSLIARGEHLAALQAEGLVLESPGGTERLAVPAVGDPAELDLDADTVVLLTVKGQDTEAALERLVAVGPPELAVVCAQNGVENERRVLRRFARTYALCVMAPTTHLQPGVVQAHSAPVTGLLDVGRYPEGVDDTAQALAEALRQATFGSVALPDVMRWKYRKLVKNLANAVEALCGAQAQGSQLAQRAQAEGEEVLAAAGIAVASRQEDAERRRQDVKVLPTASGAWSGGSTWQSLVRGTGRLEVDYLNGEIVLVARQLGLRAPVNELLVAEAAALVRRGPPAVRLDPDELLARV
jgi:2-dehydropantoate 2-reductase